jgi:hypothetical protein
MNYKDLVETALRNYLALSLPTAEDTGWNDGYDGDIFTVEGTLIRYLGPLTFTLIPEGEGWVFTAVHHGLDEMVGEPQSSLSCPVESREQADDVLLRFTVALLGRAIDKMLRIE